MTEFREQYNFLRHDDKSIVLENLSVVYYTNLEVTT